MLTMISIVNKLNSRGAGVMYSVDPYRISVNTVRTYRLSVNEVGPYRLSANTVATRHILEICTIFI